MNIRSSHDPNAPFEPEVHTIPEAHDPGVDQTTEDMPIALPVIKSYGPEVRQEPNRTPTPMVDANVWPDSYRRGRDNECEEAIRQEGRSLHTNIHNAESRLSNGAHNTEARLDAELGAGSRQLGETEARLGHSVCEVDKHIGDTETRLTRGQGDLGKSVSDAETRLTRGQGELGGAVRDTTSRVSRDVDHAGHRSVDATKDAVHSLSRQIGQSDAETLEALRAETRALQAESRGILDKLCHGFKEVVLEQAEGFDDIKSSTAAGFAQAQRDVASGFASTQRDIATSAKDAALGFATAQRDVAAGFSAASRDLCESTSSINSNVARGFSDVSVAQVGFAKDTQIGFREAATLAEKNAAASALAIAESKYATLVGFQNSAAQIEKVTAAIQLEQVRNAAAAQLEAKLNATAAELTAQRNANAAQLLAQQNQSAIAAQLAECCCELTCKIDGIKDDVRKDGDETRELLNSQEQARIARDLADAKNEIILLKSKLPQGTVV